MKVMTNNCGGAKVALILVLLVIAGGGGGFLAYQKYLKKSAVPVSADLPQVNLNDDLVGFAYRRLPELYEKLSRMDREIGLVDMELARLDSLEAAYPQQSRIIKTERVGWEKLKKNLQKVVSTYEAKIEMIYVAFMVNEENAKHLVEENKAALLSIGDEILETSGAQTVRINVEQPKTLVEKIKAAFLK